MATILFSLWRRRLLVACAALVAALAGFAVAFRVSIPPKFESRQYVVGTADARVLVDTPSSQVSAVSPLGVDALPARADLLANLMVDGVVKTTIAGLAGLRPDQIQGIAQSSTGQPPSAPPNPRGYVLTTNVITDSSGSPLPIIDITTQAPDVRAAARLANAAVAGLQGYLASQAASQGVPARSRLQVIGLGAAQTTGVVHGPGPLVAVALAIFIFVIGCGAILVVPAMIRDWRAVSEAQTLADDLQDTFVRSGAERRIRLRRWPRAVPKPLNAEDLDLPPVIGSGASPQRVTGSRG